MKPIHFVLPVILLSLSISERAEAMGRAQSLGTIQAESAVPKEQTQKLRQDFEWLNTLGSRTAPEEMTRVMGLQEVSAPALSSWLNERVNYVLAEDYELSLMNIRPYFFKDFEFPRTELPEIERPEEANFDPLLDPARMYPEGLQSFVGSEPAPQGKVVMANLGAALYVAGKASGLLLSSKIRGIGRVPVTSPRVGIIQVGEGLFYDGYFGEEFGPESPVRRAFRLDTFFHEARHSDGNGKSLGFLHALCPAGHDYEGQGACDRSTNGPYTVGALVSEELSVNCTECSEGEREAIRLIGLESRSRIIPQKDGSPAIDWDGTHEGSFTPKKARRKN